MTERTDEKRSEQAPAAQESDCCHPGDLDDVRRFRFEDLATGRRRIKISLGETVYELRLTRNGRLELNK